jgi:hypothetical protein
VPTVPTVSGRTAFARSPFVRRQRASAAAPRGPFRTALAEKGRCPVDPSRWWFRGLLAAFVAAVLVLAAPTPANPQSGLGIGLVQLYRVEEDWSLSVNQPDSGLAAPQVSTQMARSLTTSRFCNLHLNSTDLPTFAIGGLQLQSWQGSNNLAVYTATSGAIMATPSELVTWTQYLRVANNSVYFGIGTLQPGVAGSSSKTWGDFSGIEIQVPGARADLSNYNRSYSENNSGVTFGANRVDTFTLVGIRYYYTDGSVITDSNAHVVYSSQSGALGGGE